MKIIFLDVDGVLNSGWTKTPLHYIEKDKFLQLKRIVNETGAKVVVSSSWREHKGFHNLLTDFLNCVDIEVVGSTAIYAKREDEIQAWLKANHEPIESFVILDDWDMSETFPDNMVHTVSYHRMGLDQEFANKAIEILNKE